MIRNLGTEQQDLTAWRLESDPPGDESYSLSQVGVLGAGESIIVESGPGASLALVWSNEPVFRDGDGSDYARIVNEASETVDQMNCGDAALDESSPSSESPSTAPAPSALGELEIPNGGGAPPLAPALPTSMLASLGGALMMGALAFLVAVGLPQASRQAPASLAGTGVAGAAPARTSPRGRRSGGGSLVTPVMLAGLVFLLLVKLARSR